MKKFSTYLVLATLGLAAVGCSDDSDDAAPSKTSLLTAKSWRNTDLKVANTSVYALFVDDCNKDDLLKFNTSKSLTYTGGTVKCDPAEAATQTGSWDLLTNETQLRITDPDGEAMTGTITTLNSTTLVLTATEDITGTGTPVAVEVTFTAQ